MACPPYQPPAATAVNAALAGGYAVPAAAAVDAVLDPCGPGPQPTGGPLYKMVAAPYGRARRRDARSLAGRWQISERLGQHAVARWNRPPAADSGTRHGWRALQRVERGAGLHWEPAGQADQGAQSGWSALPAADRLRGAGWGPAAHHVGRPVEGRWNGVYPHDARRRAAWNAAALPGHYVQPPGGAVYTPPAAADVSAALAEGYSAPASGAISAVLSGGGRPAYLAVRQDATPVGVPWGRIPVCETVVVIPWGPGGRYGGRDPLVGLPWVDEPPPPTPSPPSLRVHIVMNNVAVVRLPDMTPIAVSAVDLSTNVDTWCWSVRIELADPSQLSLLVPDGNGPRLVQITMNSYVWTAVIEGRTRSRGFGATTVTVVGRSRTALLDAPYAPRRSGAVDEARTARQLAEVELTNTGFTLDWSGVDWLVPGGAWYYSDLTPMAVLSDIANAAGAVLQSHPADAAIALRPRYATAPWGWAAATADLILPASWVTDDSTQYASKPLYDTVLVRGEQQGVQARITRQGSAGETFAEQVVHKLITHADVAVQRGTAAIGDRGEQELVDVQIPLFVPGTETAGSTGLYLPLNLVEVRDIASTWRGLSVGVSISARRAGLDGRGLEVWQNVSLERHLTDAS